MSIAMKPVAAVPVAEPVGAWRPLLLGSVVFSAVAASLPVLKFAPVPFFWLWLTWAVALWAALFGVSGSWPRAVLFNLGIVAVLMAAGEAYLAAHEYAPPIYPKGGYIVHDEVLGWAPANGIKARAIKPEPTGLFHHPKGMLFDVTYTIDSNGLRIAPPYRMGDVAGTALFFGCSFAFGEGLKDDETLPYQVGLQSGGRYRTYNFAFHAYGPNQMLAAIEHGNVRRIVDSTPRDAIYVAIPGHVWRVAGRVAWGGHAPRYVLDADGTVHEAGFFEDRKSLNERLGLGFDSVLRGQLNKSAMWRILPMRDSQITDDDIRLYFAVVRRSQELLEAEFPGIRFCVVLWPYQDAPQQRETYEKLRDGFYQMGIPLYLVDDILPGYGTDRSVYILSSRDHHPNALANRLLAQFVIAKLLR